MSRALEDLPNLGPQTAAWLREAGIADEPALRAVGAVAAFQALKRARPGVTLTALWALDAALAGVSWLSLDPARKEELKRAAAWDPLDL